MSSVPAPADPRPKTANGLPSNNRYITTHNSSGQAIYANSIPEACPWAEVSSIAHFGPAYLSEGFPVNLNDESDIKKYDQILKNPVGGLHSPTGSVLRFVDFAPNTPEFMHRTESLDYGVCIEGAVECLLDSGEKRLLRRGDICVQRGTMHSWKNVNEDGTWARMLFVLLPSEKVKVGDQELGNEVPSLPL